MRDLREWIGRTEESRDQVTAQGVAALAATLDRDDPWPSPGDVLPPLWHWIFCAAVRRHSELGEDGDEIRGAFLPPVPLPRRMWAGGRIEFRSPIRIGDELERGSQVMNIQSKSGRSGPLAFVTVRHEYRVGGRTAVIEEQDLVYRNRPAVDEPAPQIRKAPGGAHWRREVTADEVLLFRYSALTFNGHRIHYDHTFATGVEGYPGLVVHGPLLATLLVDLVRRHKPGLAPRSFSFRALCPVFAGSPFFLCGREEGEGAIRLWVQDVAGACAMEAGVQSETW